jgi:hypothetical protein
VRSIQQKQEILLRKARRNCGSNSQKASYYEKGTPTSFWKYKVNNLNYVTKVQDVKEN